MSVLRRNSELRLPQSMEVRRIILSCCSGHLVLLLLTLALCARATGSHDGNTATDSGRAPFGVKQGSSSAEGTMKTLRSQTGPSVSAGMTSRFFFDFFPALGQLVSTRSPGIWGFLQPSHILEACPELEAKLPLLGNMRNPTLLPLQLAGAAVGFEGARRLLAARNPAIGLWGWSFLFFGLMNLSSIAAHVLAAHRSPAWDLAAAVDVAMTGTASLCLLYQQASSWRQHHTTKAPTLPYLLRPPATAAGAQRLALGTGAAVLAAALAGHNWMKLHWVNELLYIGTTLVAGKAAGLVARRDLAASTPHQRKYFTVAALGLVLMAAALPADRFLCRAVGPAFGTVHLLFLGSVVGYWGLYGFVTGHALGLPHSQPTVKRE